MQMQNPYGFDGSLKIKNMPFSTFLKLTQIWVYHLHSFPPQLLHPFGGTTACCEIKKKDVVYQKVVHLRVARI